MGLAIGYLNMSLDDFWDFTPRQLQIKLDARREYEDLLQRFEWERVRFQTTALINKDRKRKDQIKQTDLISFEWDKTNAIKDRQQERKKAMYLMEKEKRKLKNV